VRTLRCADLRFVTLCARLGWLESGHWPDCAGDVAYDFKAEAQGLRGHPKDAFLA
jgi:adenylate cyclase